MAFSSCEALNDGILFEPTFHHEADRFDSGGIERAMRGHAHVLVTNRERWLRSLRPYAPPWGGALRGYTGAKGRIHGVGEHAQLPTVKIPGRMK
jgi:hypothetical protein